MLRRASIYDASRPDAEDQLMFYFGNGDRNSQLREIGVAQGLCELCESFECGPVRWVKTAHESLVLHLLERSAAYPRGVWLFVACDATSIPVLQAQVRDSYRQFLLLEGSFEHCRSNNINYKRWWHDFFESWEPWDPATAIGAGYLRVASGVLSPDVGARIKELGQSLGADDIAVFDSNLECLFAGCKFDTQVWADIQAWIRPRVRSPRHEAGWSMQMPSMPSLSLSSLPSMPSLSLPSMPSLPSLSPFKKAPAQDPPQKRLQQLVKINDMEFHLQVLFADLVYVFVGPSELHVTDELAAVSKDIQGISFARDPPTEFGYLVINHRDRTCTSTLESEMEMVASMVGKEPSSTLCRGRWLKHSTLGPLEVVLCHQATEMDWGLRGEGDWVRAFARRRGIH